MNHNLRRLIGPRLFLLVLVSMPILFQSVCVGRDLTLDDAVELGLRNDETYLIAKEELDRAAGQIREAWAGALPQLGFDGRYTRNIEIPEVVIGSESIKFGTSNNYSLGLTLIQPIYLGGKVGGGLKIAKYYRSYADYKLRQTRNDVMYQVKQAFFRAKLANDVVAIYDDAIKQAELNLTNVRKQFEQGMAAEFDLLRAEVELANIRPQLIKARNDSELAAIDLKNRLGITTDEDINLMYEFDSGQLDDSLDLQSGLSYAAQNHPAIVQQDYMVKSYDRAIGITRADGRPQLLFSSTFAYQAQSEEFSPPSNAWTKSWSASLILSFPIFDGRANSGRVKQVRADYNQSKYVARQMKENVLLSVRSAYGSWEEAVASLQSQEKTIEQAEEGIRIANLRYAGGVGTQLEVLSAQTANTQAKVNYINAVYDYELSVAAFERAAGYEPTIRGEEND